MSEPICTYCEKGISNCECQEWKLKKNLKWYMRKLDSREAALRIIMDNSSEGFICYDIAKKELDK